MQEPERPRFKATFHRASGLPRPQFPHLYNGVAPSLLPYTSAGALLGLRNGGEQEDPDCVLMELTAELGVMDSDLEISATPSTEGPHWTLAADVLTAVCRQHPPPASGGCHTRPGPEVCPLPSLCLRPSLLTRGSILYHG